MANFSNFKSFFCLFCLMLLLVIVASTWFFAVIGLFNWHICMLHAPNYLHPPVESEGNYLMPRRPTMPFLSSVKADMPPERTSIHLLCLLNRQTRTHTHIHTHKHREIQEPLNIIGSRELCNKKQGLTWNKIDISERQYRLLKIAICEVKKKRREREIEKRIHSSVIWCEMHFHLSNLTRCLYHFFLHSPNYIWATIIPIRSMRSVNA